MKLTPELVVTLVLGAVQLLVTVMGWGIAIGVIYGKLQSLINAVTKLETLFGRVGELEQRAAAQTQRCDDRERMTAK
jgi:hypothetical protein